VTAGANARPRALRRAPPPYKHEARKHTPHRLLRGGVLLVKPAPSASAAHSLQHATHDADVTPIAAACLSPYGDDSPTALRDCVNARATARLLLRYLGAFSAGRRPPKIEAIHFHNLAVHCGQ
jgi:hypothetical protein